MRTKPPDPKPPTASSSVIDLTDEDDRRGGQKGSPKTPNTQKSITLPLRTAPGVRVNNTTQGLRLATSQGKVTPLNSVVTSNAPVMYVVQSPGQNGLAPGSKVLVNFQPGGVLSEFLLLI